MVVGMFNPRFARPVPLVPRPLRFEVWERLLHDGTVGEPLNEDDLAAVAARRGRGGGSCRLLAALLLQSRA